MNQHLLQSLNPLLQQQRWWKPRQQYQLRLPNLRPNQHPTAKALPVANALPRSIDPQRATDTQGTKLETAALPTPETIPAESTLTTLTPSLETPTETADASSSTVATIDTPKPVAEPRVITKPKLVEQVTQIETESQNNPTPQEAPGAGLLSLFNDAIESISDKFDSLTTLGKAVAGAILALPLLLLGLRKLVRRKRFDHSDEWEENYQAQANSHSFDQQNKSTEAIKARWDDDFLNDETQPNEAYTAQATTPVAIAPVVPTEEPAPDSTATRMAQKPNQMSAQVASTAQAEKRWQSGFGQWLSSETVADRQQHCTEFLIYWMAYADERYEKGLKQRIFTEPNPNQHDLIKRWVLKQDVFAFADTINWLKRNTSKIQQEQILELMHSA